MFLSLKWLILPQKIWRKRKMATPSRAEIIEKIRPLLLSKSKAAQRKAENAISVLEGKQPLPKGWTKKKIVHESQ